MKKLEGDELALRMNALSGWTETGGGLEKTFAFADYYRVMAFVNAVAFVAHKFDHHPDLGVHYGKVDVRYSTHDAGGITELDVTSAAQVDALARA